MDSKINYQLELDKLIKSIPAGETPTLLLHSCCAPCSSYTLEYLTQYFSITIFYYNPKRSFASALPSRNGSSRSFR